MACSLATTGRAQTSATFGCENVEEGRLVCSVTLLSGSSAYGQYAYVALGRKPCIFRHLRLLAAIIGEKVRLESSLIEMTVSLTAVVLTVGCAIAFSVADVLRKLLAEQVRALPLLVALSGGMAPFFLVWLAWQGGGGPSGGYWLPGLASALLNLAANLAFL
jgi:hypothetical protein